MKECIRKAMAAIAYKVAASSANSTSCVAIHQPKVPDGLKKLKKK